MSPAFNPPDSLSKDDIRQIADVRRKIWTEGFKGMAFGCLGGYTAHTAASKIQLWSMVKNRVKPTSGAGSGSGYLLAGMTFNKNTKFAAVMLGASLGAFAMASAAGKNNVHDLHPIFEIGKKEDEGTNYQKLVNKAKDIEDAKEREERRIRRRESLNDHLIHGQGLSDSHGGHWVDEGSGRKAP